MPGSAFPSPSSSQLYCMMLTFPALKVCNEKHIAYILEGFILNLYFFQVFDCKRNQYIPSQAIFSPYPFQAKFNKYIIYKTKATNQILFANNFVIGDFYPN